MRPGVSSGGREGYASELTGVWTRLSHALAELDEIASDPDEWLDDDSVDRLASLQYALHASAELVIGIIPPAGAEEAHAELAAALEDARDTTADVADAVASSGVAGAEVLVPEWRGALFRVRLARLRVASPQPLPAEPEVAPDRTFPTLALAATLCVVSGAVVFALGATLAAWPVWMVGICLFAGGVLIYRPRP